MGVVSSAPGQLKRYGPIVHSLLHDRSKKIGRAYGFMSLSGESCFVKQDRESSSRCFLKNHLQFNSENRFNFVESKGYGRNKTVKIHSGLGAYWMPFRSNRHFKICAQNDRVSRRHVLHDRTKDNIGSKPMMFERTTWHDGSSSSGHCFKYPVETKLMQQSRFEIGSVAKTFTVAAIVSSAAESQLGLGNKHVDPFLPVQC